MQNVSSSKDGVNNDVSAIVVLFWMEGHLSRHRFVYASLSNSKTIPVTGLEDP
jgi:acid stress-induced BolA-like protein IbaG/YrbA